MAIKRCPYCKSLIEESEKYCKNCGTQLLFPEDEAGGESIKGEKIIDDDRIRDEETEDVKLHEEDKDESDEEEAAGAPDEELEEEGPPEEKDAEEEDLKETEKVSEEEVEKKDRREPTENQEIFWTVKKEKPEEAEETIEKESLEERGAEGLKEKEIEEDLAHVLKSRTREGKNITREELVFKTQDLDKMTRSVDDAKREIEEFLMTFKDKIAKPEPPPMPPPEAKEPPGPPPVSEKPEMGREEGEKEEIPPWAESIKTSPSPAVDMSKAQEESVLETEALEKKTAAALETKPWTTDSGIGIPEGVTQPSLPFGAAGQEEKKAVEIKDVEMKKMLDQTTSEVEEFHVEEREGEEKAGEEEFEEEFGAAVGAREEAARPRPGQFARFLKAKAADVLLIFILWIVSIGIAARLVGTTIFDLIFESTVQILAVFVILLMTYFFLFLFFLGETLGDRYFSRKD